jgi:hypothetical protein
VHPRHFIRLTRPGGSIPAPSVPARERCIRRHGGPHAEMRRGYGRSGLGICWKTIPDSRSRPRSRLQSHFAPRPTVGEHDPGVGESESHAGSRQKRRGRGDGNEIRKDRPHAPPAPSERGTDIRPPGGHVRDRAGGRCRHEEVAARSNHTTRCDESVAISPAPKTAGDNRVMANPGLFRCGFDPCLVQRSLDRLPRFRLGSVAVQGHDLGIGEIG